MLKLNVKLLVKFPSPPKKNVLGAFVANGIQIGLDAPDFRVGSEAVACVVVALVHSKSLPTL